MYIHILRNRADSGNDPWSVRACDRTDLSFIAYRRICNLVAVVPTKF